jgi:hypothetical protein
MIRIDGKENNFITSRNYDSAHISLLASCFLLLVSCFLFLVAQLLASCEGTCKNLSENFKNLNANLQELERELAIYLSSSCSPLLDLAVA